MGAKVKKGDMNKKKGKEKKRERSRDESITFPTSFLLSFVSSLYSAIDDLGTNLCGKTIMPYENYLGILSNSCEKPITNPENTSRLNSFKLRFICLHLKQPF